MRKSPDALRHRARDLTAAAHSAPPGRAAQQRRTAAELVRHALRQQLSEHSATVGRRNVTAASFREFLRDHRAAEHDGPSSSRPHPHTRHTVEKSR